MTPIASKTMGNYFRATPILIPCQNITIHSNAINLRNRSDDDYFRALFANMPCSCQRVMFWLSRVIERKQYLRQSNVAPQKGHFPLISRISGTQGLKIYNEFSGNLWDQGFHGSSLWRLDGQLSAHGSVCSEEKMPWCLRRTFSSTRVPEDFISLMCD